MAELSWSVKLLRNKGKIVVNGDFDDSKFS
jgi:hypothetical protein